KSGLTDLGFGPSIQKFESSWVTLPLVSRFPGRIVIYYPYLNWKQCQRFCEFLKICRKPPVNRRTTVVPSFPVTTEADPSLTGGPPAPLTPDRRGDSR
ncbi:endotoxic shock protective protein U9-ORF-like, partial [Arvicanthis niloticus]|uniref:endotoxic shock protective protein U9-ORF-like n=1 Tax=Arvicanthis niloticus TaxID=61156 RepID=UPI00402B6C2D